MLATLLTFVAQNSQDTSDEGIGLALLLLAILVVATLVSAIIAYVVKSTRARRGTGPDRRPHRRGGVGH